MCLAECELCMYNAKWLDFKTPFIYMILQLTCTVHFCAFNLRLYAFVIHKNLYQNVIDIEYKKS